MSDFASRLIPCLSVASFGNLDETKVENRAKNTGPISGYKLFRACATELSLLNHPKLQAVLKNTYFGTIKETEDCGTTSVSQGIAQLLYNGNRFDGKLKVFANFGTGGLKLQVAAKRIVNDEEIVYIQHECKEGKEEPSPNRLKIGHFVPQNGAEDLAIHQARICQSLDRLKVELGTEDYGPICTFVTGPVRAAWEKANDHNQEMMERDLFALFKSQNFVPWNGKSFFMSQDVESEMETLAASSMYENLHLSGYLEEEMVVLCSWGIGRGSLQMGKFQLPYGMEHDDLELVPDLFSQGFADRLVGMANLYPPNTKFVIALKSGFAILLDQQKWLMESVMQDIKKWKLNNVLKEIKDHIRVANNLVLTLQQKIAISRNHAEAELTVLHVHASCMQSAIEDAISKRSSNADTMENQVTEISSNVARMESLVTSLFG